MSCSQAQDSVLFMSVQLLYLTESVLLETTWDKCCQSGFCVLYICAAPALARECDPGDHRVQVPAVAVLCAVQ